MSSGYPASDEYNTAIQMPTASFADPELKTAKVKTNAFGYPVALGGGFALTYEMTVAGRKRLAVRCFHKQANGLEAKYARISSCLASLREGPFVGFEFQPQGIRVNGRGYPLVKMDWAEGETLGSYLETAHADRVALNKLLAKFRDLSKFLQAKGIAHGDLQNGNVLVGNSGLSLIDYDGMYVPGMTTGGGSELGQVHFQHPGRSADDFGPLMDRFSLIVIDLSLRALLERPELFQRHSSGENIVLSAADYRSPSISPVFSDLRSIPAIASEVDRLASLCVGPVAAVPTLEDFLAGRGGTAAVVIRPTTATAPAPMPGVYIGAYPVVDGADYAAVVKVVGDKVEIIARIAEVREARTKYGRPYVFLNFGHWKGNIAKVNIWSTGLKKFSRPPDTSWEGQWVSVTGLVDPIWENDKRGYRHVSITVNDANQVRVISEVEAKRRLASCHQPALGQRSVSAAMQPAVSRNTDIVRQVQKAGPAPVVIPTFTAKPIASTPVVRTTPAKSANQALADSVKRASSGTVRSSPQRTATERQPPWSPPSPSYHSAPPHQQESGGLMFNLGKMVRSLFGR